MFKATSLFKVFLLATAVVRRKAGIVDGSKSNSVSTVGASYSTPPLGSRKRMTKVTT